MRTRPGGGGPEVIVGAIGGRWKVEGGPETVQQISYGQNSAPRGGLEVQKCRFGEGLEKRMKI